MVTMITGISVSPSVFPRWPPELSYSATWSRTHWAGLGSYSPSMGMTRFYAPAALSGAGPRLEGEQPPERARYRTGAERLSSRVMGLGLSVVCGASGGLGPAVLDAMAALGDPVVGVASLRSDPEKLAALRWDIQWLGARPPRPHAGGAL